MEDDLQSNEITSILTRGYSFQIKEGSTVLHVYTIYYILRIVCTVNANCTVIL